MKRFYDSFIECFIYTLPHDDEYSMMFDSGWKFTEMLDYMCDQFSIDRNSISEIRQTFVRRYKLSKDV